jgi:hypothetical protein
VKLAVKHRWFIFFISCGFVLAAAAVVMHVCVALELADTFAFHFTQALNLSEALDDWNDGRVVSHKVSVQLSPALHFNITWNQQCGAWYCIMVFDCDAFGTKDWLSLVVALVPVALIIMSIARALIKAAGVF